MIPSYEAGKQSTQTYKKELGICTKIVDKCLHEIDTYIRKHIKVCSTRTVEYKLPKYVTNFPNFEMFEKMLREKMDEFGYSLYISYISSYSKIAHISWYNS